VLYRVGSPDITCTLQDASSSPNPTPLRTLAGSAILGGWLRDRTWWAIEDLNL
jgi:hypothetical protein